MLDKSSKIHFKRELMALWQIFIMKTFCGDLWEKVLGKIHRFWIGGFSCDCCWYNFSTVVELDQIKFFYLLLIQGRHKLAVKVWPPVQEDRTLTGLETLYDYKKYVTLHSKKCKQMEIWTTNPEGTENVTFWYETMCVIGTWCLPPFLCVYCVIYQ